SSPASGAGRASGTNDALPSASAADAPDHAAASASTHENQENDAVRRQTARDDADDEDDADAEVEASGLRRGAHGSPLPPVAVNRAGRLRFSQVHDARPDAAARHSPFAVMKKPMGEREAKAKVTALLRAVGERHLQQQITQSPASASPLARDASHAKKVQFSFGRELPVAVTVEDVDAADAHAAATAATSAAASVAASSASALTASLPFSAPSLTPNPKSGFKLGSKEHEVLLTSPTPGPGSGLAFGAASQPADRPSPKKKPGPAAGFSFHPDAGVPPKAPAPKAATTSAAAPAPATSGFASLDWGKTTATASVAPPVS
ncbi:hypothetical protein CAUPRSCDRAFT_12734, partial [Caulochytrium protostelioides]